MSVPPYLYKYRRFNQYFLNEVCDGSIYFASPESFNDPLDTKPSLVGDSSEQDKESLFRALYLSQFSNKDVASKISELRYLSTEHGDANQKYNYDRLLMSRIENIFLKEIRSYGVLSLAQNWNCPVMWSHYAEQHTGICLEFSTDKNLTENLSEVRYDATRSIDLQDLASWKLKRNKAARKKILDISLLSKAPAWSYECEWRVISKSPGLHSTPFDISAIHFGQRCPSSVKTALIKMLHDTFPKIVFYDIQFDPQTFELRRFQIDIDEVVQTGVRESVLLAFGRVDPILPPDAIQIFQPLSEDEGPPYLQN